MNAAAVARILEEGAVPLSELTALAGTVRGKRRSVRTLARWATHGVNGVRLAAYHDGARWYSSREAMAAFLAALTESEVRRSGGRPEPRAIDTEGHRRAMEFFRRPARR